MAGRSGATHCGNGSAWRGVASVICGDVRQAPGKSEARVRNVKTIATSPSTPLTRALKSYWAWDDSRDSFPAEHWLVLAIGVAVLMTASRSSSPLKRIVGSALRGALLYRAASGRGAHAEGTANSLLIQ